MLKKSLAALLITVFMAVSLAACGNSGSKSGSSTTTEPNANSGSKSGGDATAEPNGNADARFKDEKYTLKLVTVGWEPQSGEGTVMKAINEKFAELGYPGLGVDVIGFSWADLDAGKMGAFVLSSEDYDVIWAPNWVSFWAEAFEGGAFQPWDKYLDLVPAYAEMIAPYKEILKTGGPSSETGMEVWRVPTFKEFTNIQTAMRFNLTVARELGIEDELRNIKSVDELDPYLQMFQDKHPERMAVLAVDSGNLAGAYNGGQDSNPFAPVYDRESDSYKVGIFEPWFDDYMSTLRRWVAAGFIPEYEVTDDFQNLIKMYGPESFLVYFNSGKPGLEAELNLNSENDGFEWGATSLSDNILSLDSIKGNPYALNANSKNPEAAAFIYEMLCSNAELNNLLNFGIEGVNYTLDTDGTLEKIPNSGYDPGIMSWLGNRLLCHKLPGEPADGVGPLYQEYNDSALVLPNFGFPGPTNEYIDQTKWDVFWGVHGAVWDQYGRAMMTGRLTDKDIETMKKQLIDGGVDNILKTYNDSYNAWKLENNK